MTINNKIIILHLLGEHLQSQPLGLQKAIKKASLKNAWFTEENITFALNAITSEYLDKGKLRQWVEQYPLIEKTYSPKTIGIIMAGNLPLVGFHDFLCAFLSGNRALVKLSSKDSELFTYMVDYLLSLDEQLTEQVEIVTRLSNFDAVIATGSNNSARYFDHYFEKYPHIIRKSRTSIAVLTGEETKEQIIALGKDIFTYFGLGCRNVSKLMVPKGYDFVAFLDILEKYEYISDHNKYKNNYDYNCTILLLNREPHLASKYLMLVEKEQLASAIGTLHYEYYDDETVLWEKIQQQNEQIQCVVGGASKWNGTIVDFGQAQQPKLNDYADHIDTMEFLLSLDR